MQHQQSSPVQSQSTNLPSITSGQDSSQSLQSSSLPPSLSPRSATHRNPYCSLPLDSSIPLLPLSQLMDRNKRKGRKFWESPMDPQPMKSFGDSVIQKSAGSLRLFFQNVKGLSSSAGSEDYRYYLDCLQSLQVDVAGLSETNTCWQHPHLRDDFTSIVRKQYRQSKVVYGSPIHSVDPIPSNETFQAGGNVLLLHGGPVS